MLQLKNLQARFLHEDLNPTAFDSHGEPTTSFSSILDGFLEFFADYLNTRHCFTEGLEDFFIDNSQLELGYLNFR